MFSPDCVMSATSSIVLITLPMMAQTDYTCHDMLESCDSCQIQSVWVIVEIVMGTMGEVSE